jgi:hypothetical protein
MYWNLNSYRMTRVWFEKLFEFLNEKHNMNKFKFKLLLFLYFISHKCTYREIREIFEIPKSTVFI